MKGKPPTARLEGLAARFALRTAREVLVSAVFAERSAPSTPAHVANSASHRVSAGKTADTGGIERGRSLDPSRAMQVTQAAGRVTRRAPDGEPSNARRTTSSDLGLSILHTRCLTVMSSSSKASLSYYGFSSVSISDPRWRLSCHRPSHLDARLAAPLLATVSVHRCRRPTRDWISSAFADVVQGVALRHCGGQSRYRVSAGGSRYVFIASTTVWTNDSSMRPCRRTRAACFGDATDHGEA